MAGPTTELPGPAPVSQLCLSPRIPGELVSSRNQRQPLVPTVTHSDVDDTEAWSAL
jgi:hypothetical protein